MGRGRRLRRDTGQERSCFLPAKALRSSPCARRIPAGRGHSARFCVEGKMRRFTWWGQLSDAACTFSTLSAPSDARCDTTFTFGRLRHPLCRLQGLAGVADLLGNMSDAWLCRVRKRDPRRSEPLIGRAVAWLGGLAASTPASVALLAGTDRAVRARQRRHKTAPSGGSSLFLHP